MAAESSADQQWVDDCFTYHAPTPEQVAKLAEVTKAAKAFSYALFRFVPASADRSTALRAIREARMWANAAIVLDGRR
jgi:hypothetical protein